MTAREQADQQPLEHRVLADDHALDLVQRLLQGVARLRAQVVRLLNLVHLSSWSLSPRRGGRTSAATGRCRAAAAPGRHAGEARGDLLFDLLVAEPGGETRVGRAHARGVGSLNARPPEAVAISASCWRLTGTGTVTVLPPRVIGIVPCAVPTEIV